nr:hypothetical protein [Halanaerobiales bacterium]
MGIKITGDFDKFNKQLSKLTNFNFSGLHKEIGEYILEATKDRFKKEESPEGKKWKPSYRSRSGGKTLTDNATLKNSLNYKANSKKVDVGTNIIYAAVHQKGATIKAKNAKYLKFKVGKRWVQKTKVKIPARPFLGVSDDDRREIKNIIQDRIDEHLSG